MSGVRRKTRYRKNVEASVLNEFPEPEGENQHVVRVCESRGGNLLLVETAEGRESLCRLPQRFRNLVWVKRGSLLICESEKEESDSKVKFSVCHVLFEDQIRHLKKKDAIPRRFLSTTGNNNQSADDVSGGSASVEGVSVTPSPTRGTSSNERKTENESEDETSVVDKALSRLMVDDGGRPNDKGNVPSSSSGRRGDIVVSQDAYFEMGNRNRNRPFVMRIEEDDEDDDDDDDDDDDEGEEEEDDDDTE